jgi:hypothetical protein
MNPTASQDWTPFIIKGKKGMQVDIQKIEQEAQLIQEQQKVERGSRNQKFN